MDFLADICRLGCLQLKPIGEPQFVLILLSIFCRSRIIIGFIMNMLFAHITADFIAILYLTLHVSLNSFDRASAFLEVVLHAIPGIGNFLNHRGSIKELLSCHWCFHEILPGTTFQQLSATTAQVYDHVSALHFKVLGIKSC